ncbi:homoserine kinase [Alicyclobacillus fastidiosus]|uniref:Homoserine kinase n=1 Tax=Alicyclobacillus fastidiosus TaxID=392011 RepID=A0ABY6ZF60_9BACL|nr:homoserine kinase [Alicyclobacillus fastidiosus]WAH40784.1 homoserine kinase [Alicyclobacillus fastidiosus]GMA62260.1 homoserine kinase [Alicyclobacillus fastidiosus]
MIRKLTVRVPATSANLGPGFDCLGLALDLFNSFTLVLDEPFRIEVTGESAERLPRGEENVVVQAMRRVFQDAGLAAQSLPAFSLHLDNQIPVSSGLGSSASAIVGGLVLGNALVREIAPQKELPVERILGIATEMEGHPDNVAPALFGGGVLAFHDKAGLRTTPVPIPRDLRFVAATPDFALSTEQARKVLPTTYPRGEVVENIAQCARLMLALSTHDLDLLRGGLVDYLHEPYRRPLVPGADEVASAAVDAGAFSVTISGAGPTLLAWCTAEHAITVADEMTLAWLNAGIPCRTLVLEPALTATAAQRCFD